MQTALNWIALVTGLASIIVVIWRFGFKAALSADEKKKMQDDIQGLKDSMDALGKKVDEVDKCAREAALKIEPFWNVINKNLPHLLKFEHSENLIAKLSEDRITNEELIHLEEEVKMRLIEDNKRGGNVFVDLMALWAIEIRKTERGLGVKICGSNN